MLWWDWNAKQRLSVLAAILTVAALPWLAIGWLTNDWRAFLGGTAFLAIPQMVAWFLFVGLRTGRIPTRFGSEIRSDSPAWFWIIAAMDVAIVLFFLWIILAVLTGIPMPSV